MEADLIFAHTTGSTKLIRASRGPVLRSEPFNPRSNPSSEMFLNFVVSMKLNVQMIETYVMLASVNAKVA